MKADRKNFTIMCSSRGTGEAKNPNGIVAGHAYSVISIHEFTNYNKEVRLLRLRNPWGKLEWNGDWSDRSPLWTTELR